MPKFLKDALEEYLRKAGVTTQEEQDELVERLGFDVMPPPDDGQSLEVVRSAETGTQFLRRLDETAVRPELQVIRDRVILRDGRQWLDGPDTPEELEVDDPHAPDQRATGGGRNDA